MRRFLQGQQEPSTILILVDPMLGMSLSLGGLSSKFVVVGIPTMLIEGGEDWGDDLPSSQVAKLKPEYIMVGEEVSDVFSVESLLHLDEGCGD